MKDLIRAELLKIRTTRTVHWLLTGMLLLVAVAIVSESSNPEVERSLSLHEQRFLLHASMIPWLFTLLLGVRAFTDEFRHGSIIPTLLTDPDRRRVLLAKAAAVAVWSVAFTAAAFALGLGIGLPRLASVHAEVVVVAGQLAALFAKAALTAVLLATLGVGLGLAVRNPVVAVGAPLLWIFVGENLIAGRWPDLAKYLLVGAANALAGTPNLVTLGPLAGGLVLAGWSAVAIVAGATIMRRRDIA
jgi:ABC-2 type transport system permease protein